MSSPVTPSVPAASQQAVVEAALVLLERMGLSPADLVAAPASRVSVPTQRTLPDAASRRLLAQDTHLGIGETGTEQAPPAAPNGGYAYVLPDSPYHSA
jgi:hypothetical protein